MRLMYNDDNSSGFFFTFPEITVSISNHFSLFCLINATSLIRKAKIIKIMSEIAINSSQNVKIDFTVASIGERMVAHILDWVLKIAY